MRLAAPNPKRYLNRRVQPLLFARREVARSVKSQSIHAFRERRAVRHQLAPTSILVCLRSTDCRPLTGRILLLQPHRYARGGFAPCCIQNVRGNAIHPAIHFFNRRCIIFRCSSAAWRSSVASSLCNRRRRISRISLADIPVAQTIKIRPNFCSYSRLTHSSAIFTASSPVAAFCCSCADQVEDCAGPVFSARVSRTASSGGNPFQRTGASLTRPSPQPQASPEIPQPDCPPLPRDSARSNE